MTTIHISGGLSGNNWPNGKPLRSVQLSDGITKHFFEDGRALFIGSATHRMDYLSTWVGAQPGQTYPVAITIIGPSTVAGFFEAWNHDINELRSYSYQKTVGVTDLVSGLSMAGAELAEQLSVKRPG